MTENEQDTPEYWLRRALAEPVSDEPMRQLAHRSMLAFAADVPDLQAIVDEMTAPVRAELDLHLGGAGVSDHETRAFELGRFMNRTASAVKEIAKSIGGLGRLSPNLQVVAPAPGSVRVVFRAPDHRTTQEPLQEATRTESIESAAMRKLVALLLQAEREEDPDDSPLHASLHELQGTARNAVRLLGDAVLDGHWRLEGEFRRRGQQTAEISLSEAGAYRLVSAAKATEGRVEHATLTGVVDGWVWSEEVMSFEPEGARRFRASVEERLQAVVANLVHEPRPAVQARFTVVVTYPTGDTRSARRSYSLDEIEVMHQSQLEV